MKTKTAAAALFLGLLLPVTAFAAGCSHDEARMSCASGQVWDDAAKKCTTPTG